jgi:gamma-glutamyltranspeptidase/glutathione hydrolase
MKFFEHDFQSRRSVVMSRHGMAASSQPLAVEAAISTLKSGGNAIDAAVTAHAVLSVIEPHSTGLGGDLFAVMWLAKEQRLVGINASGRSPLASSVNDILAEGHTQVPQDGALSITVPGALDGMAKCLDEYGNDHAGKGPRAGHCLCAGRLSRY